MTGLWETLRHTGIGCHSAFVPLNCLYMCRFVTQSLLLLISSVAQRYCDHRPRFVFSIFLFPLFTLALSLQFFFFVSMILLAFFSSATFFCFETPPSHRAVRYCSNCFLQLHWPNKRKWPLMLIAHKRH